MTCCDGWSVTVAELLDAPLATLDGRLANAADLVAIDALLADLWPVALAIALVTVLLLAIFLRALLAPCTCLRPACSPRSPRSA